MSPEIQYLEKKREAPKPEDEKTTSRPKR